VTDLVWARGPTDPDLAHIRETRDGIPVVYLVEGALTGYALCGAWLIADIPTGEHPQFQECTTCVNIAAGISRGDLPEPRWSDNR
jgi:hypothetical protein